jgi:hypothetical protein
VGWTPGGWTGSHWVPFHHQAPSAENWPWGGGGGGSDTLRLVPHFGQNMAPGGHSVPQIEQIDGELGLSIVCTLRVRAWRA